MIFRMTRCVRGSTIGNRPGARAANQRLFVNDLNGPLYLLDKETRKLSLYLNFNGREYIPGDISTGNVWYADYREDAGLGWRWQSAAPSIPLLVDNEGELYTLSKSATGMIHFAKSWRRRRTESFFRWNSTMQRRVLPMGGRGGDGRVDDAERNGAGRKRHTRRRRSRGGRRRQPRPRLDHDLQIHFTAEAGRAAAESERTIDIFNLPQL